MGLQWLDYLREFNLLSVLVRLALSVILSGIVGYERERKGQPAGLRTHMLVCLGSALAILTNLYLAQMNAFADPTRIAAQVVSGIGFLGAGAIVVTGKLQRQVKGLTTAAGLWGSACMGLALGAGFYEGAIFGFALMILIIAVLHNLDERIHKNMSSLQLYAEFIDISGVRAFVSELRRLGCNIESAELSPKGSGGLGGMAGFFVIRYPSKSISEAKLTDSAQHAEGVLLVESI